MKKQRVASKLTIREIEEQADGYTWTTYLVQGWKENGKYKRKKFKDLNKAKAFAARKQVALENDGAKLHNPLTRLTPEQVREAETSFERLGERYGITEAVDYFLRHFCEPDFVITVHDALRKFLEAKERDGVRSRSIRQLESTVRQFEAFLFVRLLDGQAKPLHKSAKATLCRQRAARPREIALRMEKELRPPFREAARVVGHESAAAVPKIMKRLKGKVAAAAGSARDEIERGRAPREWEIVAQMRVSFPDIQSPQLHEIGPGDVEVFLRSLRGKDGESPASKKTWNNYRADLHSFFSWCSDKQRRWISENPAADVNKFKVSRDVPEILTVHETRELLAFVAGYKEGVMARYFALALFSGLRTGPDGELQKLARHPDRAKLIDLKQGVIHVKPGISKTSQYRQIEIRPNLHRWLVESPQEILPPNYDRMLKEIRAEFGLGHDVLRHTFFSMHVGAFSSVGRAALEGGNTEGVIRRHYLNLASMGEAKEFWKIQPRKGGKILRMA